MSADADFTRLLEELKTAAFRAVAPVGRCPLCGSDVGGHAVPQVPATSTAPANPYAPSEKQVAYYQRLAGSPVFSAEERRRALEWLATKATRQTIKDQIDWLKSQVESRRTPHHTTGK